jgi:hypothetical protein
LFFSFHHQAHSLLLFLIHSFRTRRLPWQALYYLDIFKSICL